MQEPNGIRVHMASTLGRGLMAVAFSALAATASAFPTLGVPPGAQAGLPIELRADGFTPGGYPGIILWDGVEAHRIFIRGR